VGSTVQHSYRVEVKQDAFAYFAYSNSTSSTVPAADKQKRPAVDAAGFKSRRGKEDICKHLDGKALFAGVLRVLASSHREMRDSPHLHEIERSAEFREY
jgi:hypothetical protein